MAVQDTFSARPAVAADRPGPSNSRTTAAWLVPITAAGEVALMLKVLSQALIPPLVVFSVLLTVVALITFFRPRTWTMVFGAVAFVAFTAGNGPIVIDGLLNPVASPHQWDEALALLGGVLGSVSAVAAVVEARRPARAVPALRAPLGEALAILCVGAMIGATYTGIAAYREVQASPGAGVANGVQSAPEQAPVELAAQGSVFVQKALELRTGSGAVYVVNHDSQPHTFDTSVAGHHYSYPVPARSTIAVVLNFPTAGRYTYWCAISGHRTNGMEGTISVS